MNEIDPKLTVEMQKVEERVVASHNRRQQLKKIGNKVRQHRNKFITAGLAATAAATLVGILGSGNNEAHIASPPSHSVIDKENAEKDARTPFGEEYRRAKQEALVVADGLLDTMSDPRMHTETVPDEGGELISNADYRKMDRSVPWLGAVYITGPRELILAGSQFREGEGTKLFSSASTTFYLSDSANSILKAHSGAMTPALIHQAIHAEGVDLMSIAGGRDFRTGERSEVLFTSLGSDDLSDWGGVNNGPSLVTPQTNPDALRARVRGAVAGAQEGAAALQIG